MRVIIVGGVAGGATAAARIRRLDESAEIIIYERSGYISYANCGLPYYIGGVIQDESDLTLQTPQSFYSRFRINVNVNHEVVKINSLDKTVLVKNVLTNEEFTDKYDKLILSVGAKPIVLDGVEIKEPIFTLRTVEDTFKIRSFIINNNPKNAVVIGGGFIGLEMAENLKNQGIDTTIIQRNSHLLNILDKDMASMVHSEFRKQGVNLLLNTTIETIEKIGDKLKLTLLNGMTLETDLLIMSIGVVPENKLAKELGLELGIKGAIKVNSKMETSIKDIYAVGDVVELKHFVSNEDSVISLAGPANKQGRIAADNICGLNSEYKGSQGSSIIKLFDLTVASTGINEDTAKRLMLNYEKVILSPLSHAGYYPGGKVLTLKVLYDKDSLNILGGQIVGYDGVDKRIDVLATSIRAKMKATELKDLDLAYAPPYSSAKDPINMAGFIIDNIENGIVKQFYYDDIEHLRKSKDVILLDTRTVYEYNKGYVLGFINIPLDDLRERINELDKTKKIYVMCQSGLRSYLATRILVQNGFDAYNFVGGYRLYSSIYKEESLSKECYPCGMDKEKA